MLQITQRHLSAGTATATTTHILHRDFETRSCVVLKSVGAYKYATDSSTTVLCCALAVDDEPVQLWMPGDPVPPEFIKAATDPTWIVAAHNDAFETAIEQYILAPRYGWPVIRFDATHDPRDEPYCETACRIFRVPSGSYTKD